MRPPRSPQHPGGRSIRLGDQQADRSLEEGLAARFALERQKVRDDPWYAVEQGYVLTEDEKRGGQTAPMPAIPYMEILTRLWQIHPIGLILKSRQLMASWLWVWLQLHMALYRPGTLTILQGKRLDDVKAVGTKSLMGRALFIYHNLPWFLKPKVELKQTGGDPTQQQSQTLTSLVVPSGGVFIAAPQGPNIIRSRTATSVQMDELPHHQDGKQAWNASVPTMVGAEPQPLQRKPDWLDAWNKKYPDLAGDWLKWHPAKLWGVGTPNGPEWVATKMDIDSWRLWPELTGFKYEDQGGEVEGLRYRLVEQKFGDYSLPSILCLRLHYTSEMNPKAWAIRRASEAAYDTPAAYEAENEISIRVVSGSSVFGAREFGARHIKTWEIDPRRGLSISMDTGYQGQSVCFWQHTVVQVAPETFWLRCHLFDHFIEKGMMLDDVLDLVKTKLYRYGLDWRKAKFYTDYNSLNTRHGGVGISDMMVFREHKIHPMARRVGAFQKDQCITWTRKLLRTWTDGRPGIEVDPRCKRVIEMFDGGWRYEEAAAGKGPVESPAKDGTYDHIGDSVIYLPWNIRRRIWGGIVNIEDVPLDEASVDMTALKAKNQMRKSRDRGGGGGAGPTALNLLD